MPPATPAASAPTLHGRLARAAFRLVVAAGFIVVLAANLPGHMSFDSVVQLFEGRMGVQLSFNPPVMSWLLGRFDAILPGQALYTAACATLLFAGLFALPALSPRASWLGVVVAAALFFTPQLLIYQGIVWKDVLFANLAVAGFICLAYAGRRWDHLGWRTLSLAAALVLLATAGLVRQNGLLIELLAALALGWNASGGRWGRGVAWGAAGFVAMVLLGQAIGAAVAVEGSTQSGDFNRGLRVLEHFDVVGAAARDPGLRLEVLEREAPQTAAAIRASGVHYYSPERVDTLTADSALMRTIWHTSDAAMRGQWLDIIVHHPLTYLRERIVVFRYLVAPPQVERCLPFVTGVDGPLDKMTELDLPHGWEPQDNALAVYANRFVHTPVFSHLSYAAAAGLVALLLLLRRNPADVVMIAMMLAALGFAASFLFMSIACDYRYLYFLDVAAMVGVLYLALDPPFGARRKRA